MAGMYPDNQQITLFGESVEWPGMNSEGKFTNGSFDDPLEKPSFIPAETLNLILDNLSSVVAGAANVPNNTSSSQVLEAIEKLIKKKSDDYWIKFFENKIYVQRWGDTNPADIWDFDGYRWAEVDRQGVFDRPRGAGAPFKTMINGVETDLTGGGSSEFDGAVHGDKTRDFLFEIPTAVEDYNNLNKDLVEAIGNTNYDYGGRWFNKITPTDYDTSSCYIYKLSAQKKIPVGNENSPIFQTSIYWKLEEIPQP